VKRMEEDCGRGSRYRQPKPCCGACKSAKVFAVQCGRAAPPAAHEHDLAIAVVHKFTLYVRDIGRLKDRAKRMQLECRCSDIYNTHPDYMIVLIDNILTLCPKPLTSIGQADNMLSDNLKRRCKRNMKIRDTSQTLTEDTQQTTRSLRRIRIGGHFCQRNPAALVGDRCRSAEDIEETGLGAHYYNEPHLSTPKATWKAAQIFFRIGFYTIAYLAALLISSLSGHFIYSHKPSLFRNYIRDYFQLLKNYSFAIPDNHSNAIRGGGWCCSYLLDGKREFDFPDELPLTVSGPTNQSSPSGRLGCRTPSVAWVKRKKSEENDSHHDMHVKSQGN
jgi:hypothetical protein